MIRAGLLGSGISGSLSPAIHEAEARALGISLTYEIFDIAAAALDAFDISGFLANLRQGGYAGLNVTHPLKQRVMAHLANLDDDAARLGAVNTICFSNAGATGSNTDWSGFSDSIAKVWPDADLSHVVQIGAGGAGAATAYALLSRGCTSLLINDASDAQAQALVDRLAALFPNAQIAVAGDPDSAMAPATGLVQASPIGMEGHEGLPVPTQLLRPEIWVADIIYFPQETALLKAARACGCRTMNGNAMVVRQAGRAFAMFTGLTPDIDRMMAAFGETLQQKTRI